MGFVLAKHVERRFPGVLIQGDTLLTLHQDLTEEAPDSYALQRVREWIEGYEQALDHLALTLPYPEEDRLTERSDPDGSGGVTPPLGFEPARWHWVVDEVMPRVGMWVGKPTYARARSWIEGFGATDTFLDDFQKWLTDGPVAWPAVVLREVWPERDEDDLAYPEEDAVAIAHLRQRLLGYLGSRGPSDRC